MARVELEPVESPGPGIEDEVLREAPDLGVELHLGPPIDRLGGRRRQLDDDIG
jgi:hypothetical protein